MGKYIVSARKYRPSNFSEVIGQSHITETLQNAIKNDHLAHSFLFCGPRGVGKTTCARILAKTINCENLTESVEPCNECDSCISFNNSNSFNIHELDAASNNKVEDMRVLIDQVRVPPPSGKYKIYIIDEVHMLSMSAFNAFLKTLEEPPSHTIFILATTEKHKIIATILSRCQIFDFKRISIQMLVENMKGICVNEGVEAEEEALHIIAQKADGSVRDSLSILDRLLSFSGKTLSYEDVLQNLNVLDYDYFFKATNFLLLEDIPSSLLLLDEVLEKGFDCDDFNLGLSEHFRNLLVCKDQKTKSLMEVSGLLKDRYIEQSTIAPASFLLNGLKFMNECDVQNRMSKNRRLTVELTLMKMAAIRSLKDFKDLPGSEPASTKKNTGNKVVSPPKEVEKDTIEKSTEVEEDAVKPEPDAQLKSEVSKENPVSAEESKEDKDHKKEEKEELSEKSEEKADKKVEETQKEDSEPEQKSADKQSEKTKGQKEWHDQSFTMVKTPKITDMKKVYEDVSKKAEEQKKAEQNERKGKVDLSGVDKESLLKAWKQYGEHLEKKKRKSLKDLVASFEPIIENNKIKLIIESSIQKELLINEEKKLVDYLCDSLGLPNVNFEFVINKALNKKKKNVAYTSKDKYNKIVEKNPAIEDLKNKLGLELDF